VNGKLLCFAIQNRHGRFIGIKSLDMSVLISTGTNNLIPFTSMS
jgi:hypothetical protein